MGGPVPAKGRDVSEPAGALPEWAVKMANTGFRLWHIGAGRVTNAKDVARGYPVKTAPAEGVWSEKDLGDVGAILFMAFHRDRLATMLASVRESALREAACLALSEMRKDICDAILLLVEKPPREAGWVVVPPGADNEIMRRAKEAYPDHPFFARMKDIEREIAKNGWLVAPPKETK